MAPVATRSTSLDSAFKFLKNLTIQLQFFILPHFFRLAATVSRRHHHVLRADPEPGAYPLLRFLTNHSPLASPMHRVVTTNKNQRLLPHAHNANCSKIVASSLCTEVSNKRKAFPAQISYQQEPAARQPIMLKILSHCSEQWPITTILVPYYI